MATSVELVGILQFLPLLSYFLVLVIVYAVLNKTGLVGESKWLQFIAAFLVATVFVSALKPQEFVLAIVPWFAIVLIGLFLVFILTAFTGGLESFQKGVGIGFVVVLILLFIVTFLFSFSGYYGPYLPWSNGAGADPVVYSLSRWLYSANVFGSVVFVIATGIVGWVLVRD